MRPALALAGAFAIPAALLGALGAREVDDLYLTHMVAVGATMLVAGLAACVDALRELLGTVALAA